MRLPRRPCRGPASRHVGRRAQSLEHHRRRRSRADPTTEVASDIHGGLVASATSPPYNGPMPTLNERAHELCDAMAADADKLGVAVSMLPCGTRLIDCGVKTPGSVEAGRRLAHICLSGLGDVYISAAGQDPSTSQEVTVATKAPIAACMASQYAGWEIKAEKFFAMGSGPMRAAACREEIFKDIGNCERPTVCVGVLETRKVPPDGVCTNIAEKCDIMPEKLTLLVAPTASIAGTVQIVARSVETASAQAACARFRPVARGQRLRKSATAACCR